MEKFKNLEDMDLVGYIDVKERLPSEEKRYQVIVHGGSMSIYYYETKLRFNKKRNVFPRMDWDYVIMWKEIED